MATPDLTTRSSGVVLRIEAALREPRRRFLTVLTGIAVAVVLHAVTGEPQVAWFSAAPVVAAGLAGGARSGLAAAAVAAVAHLAVDVAFAAGTEGVLGLFARTIVLPGLGVIGAVVSRIEAQRDTAVQRSFTEDAVTGLLNVRAFYDALDELRERGTPYAILLADIAGMRRLNEQHGHPMGTEALRALGHVLRRNVKPDDLVARLGSDEIAVALIDADVRSAVMAARRLSERLAEESLALPDGSTFRIRVYFGISTFPDDGEDAVTLLRHAQHAVTEAKRRGPDEIGVASSIEEG